MSLSLYSRCLHEFLWILHRPIHFYNFTFVLQFLAIFPIDDTIFHYPLEAARGSFLFPFTSPTPGGESRAFGPHKVLLATKNPATVDRVSKWQIQHCILTYFADSMLQSNYVFFGVWREVFFLGMAMIQPWILSFCLVVPTREVLSTCHFCYWVCPIGAHVDDGWVGVPHSWRINKKEHEWFRWYLPWVGYNYNMS